MQIARLRRVLLRSKENPTKVPLANIPFLADNKRFCIFSGNTRQKSHPSVWMGDFFTAWFESSNSLPPLQHAKRVLNQGGPVGFLRRPHKFHIPRHCLKGSALFIPLFVLSPPKTLRWFSVGHPMNGNSRDAGSEFEPRVFHKSSLQAVTDSASPIRGGHSSWNIQRFTVFPCRFIP